MECGARGHLECGDRGTRSAGRPLSLSIVSYAMMASQVEYADQLQ